jgi:hypothetical protein
LLFIVQYSYDASTEVDRVAVQEPVMLSPRQVDCPTDAELERSAFNAAFYELGLRWHWDLATYERLAADPCERSRVHSYIAHAHPHLLSAYDADFLTQTILEVKRRLERSLAHCTRDALPSFDWADACRGEVGI